LLPVLSERLLLGLWDLFLGIKRGNKFHRIFLSIFIILSNSDADAAMLRPR
jgi:hypothetical protein